MLFLASLAVLLAAFVGLEVQAQPPLKGIDPGCFPSMEIRPRADAVNRQDLSSFEAVPAMLPIVRHHIISYDLLRRVYNSVIRRDGESRNQLITLLNALSENARSRGVTLSIHVELFLRAMQNGLPANFMDNDDSAAATLHALFIWMPFNFFYGPQHRYDDRGGVLDEGARLIVESFHVDHWTRIVRLNELLIQYVNQQGYMADSPAFNEAVTIMLELLRALPNGYGFDDDIWEIVTYSEPTQSYLYRVRGSTKYYTTPRTDLRKRSARHTTTTKDPFCLNTLQVINENITNCIYLWDSQKNTLWDLEKLQLANVARLTKSKHVVYASKYPSWQEYLNRLYSNELDEVPTDRSTALCFGDGSVILYAASTQHGFSYIPDKPATYAYSDYLIYLDKNQRPVMALQAASNDYPLRYRDQRWSDVFSLRAFLEDNIGNYVSDERVPRFPNVCS